MGGKAGVGLKSRFGRGVAYRDCALPGFNYLQNWHGESIV